MVVEHNICNNFTESNCTSSAIKLNTKIYFDNSPLDARMNRIASDDIGMDDEMGDGRRAPAGTNKYDWLFASSRP